MKRIVIFLDTKCRNGMMKFLKKKKPLFNKGFAYVFHEICAYL